MKTCRECKIEKLEEEFYKRKSNSDGLYSYCKGCCREKNRQSHEKYREERLRKNSEYRISHRDELNQKAKEYYYKNRSQVLEKAITYRKNNKSKISLRDALRRKNDPQRFEKNRINHQIWREKNRDRINEWQRNWYHANKEKRKAHVILKRAIESCKIERPTQCSECYMDCKPDGHHEDYKFPLNVIWLCRKCHSRKSPRTVLQ